MKESTRTLLSAIAVSAALAIAILDGLLAGFGAADLRQTLADFATRPPRSTRMALSPAWLWGVPVAIVAGTVGAWRGLAARPRAQLVACIMLAVLALAALGYTHMALRAPLAEMYENLRPS